MYRVGSLNWWAISRYTDVLFILKHPELFSSAVMASADPMLLGADPPHHGQVRRIINNYFVPKQIAALEPHIHSLTRQLIAQFRPSGRCDLVADLAAPLPASVIAKILGIDPARQADFRRWSDAVVKRATGRLPAHDQAGMAVDHDQESVAHFYRFFHQTIARQQKNPADTFIGRLLEAEVGGKRLAPADILSLCVLLLIGGNETTTNLIGNAVLALLRRPRVLPALLANPSLVPQLVEETLRYDPPVQFLLRQATQPVTLSGTKIPAGATVMALIGAANRDETRFAHAGRFHMTRHSPKHLSYGFGIHYCPGAYLSRLEARIALTTALALLQNPALKNTAIPLMDSVQLRGPKHLYLTFEAAAADFCQGKKIEEKKAPYGHTSHAG